MFYASGLTCAYYYACLNVHYTVHSPVYPPAHRPKEKTNGKGGPTQTDGRYVHTYYCKHTYLQIAKVSEGKQAHVKWNPQKATEQVWNNTTMLLDQPCVYCIHGLISITRY